MYVLWFFTGKDALCGNEVSEVLSLLPQVDKVEALKSKIYHCIRWFLMKMC